MADSFDYAAYLPLFFPEVGYREFYRDVFPVGTLQRTREAVKGEYPAIAVVVRDGGNIRRTVTDDLSAIDTVVNDARSGDLCVMSPVTYAGMAQRKSMAHALHALVFDVDGLRVEEGEPRGLNQLLYQAGPILETAAADFAIPMPTYIVSSGTGLHFYYVLEEPLVLWPSVMERVEAYRAYLTGQLWNRYACELWRSVQYEGATQGFRMVGTPVKPTAGEGVVRAFLTGTRVSIGYMDRFVPEEARIGVFGLRKNRIPMAAASERWPKWYRRRIVDGIPRATWRNKRDLYDWWVRRVESEGKAGHRYNCIVALAAYARKCGIDREELERDAERLRVLLDERNPGNPFTDRDVSDALTAYRAGMVRYPIDEIVKRTDIPIEKNKRNGLKRSQHLYLARRRKQDMKEIGLPMKNNEGRPRGSGTKRDLIRSYAAEHPEMSNRQIASNLGVSRNTVNKWLKPGWREEHGANSFACALSMAECDAEKIPTGKRGGVSYFYMDTETGDAVDLTARAFNVTERRGGGGDDNR